MISMFVREHCLKFNETSYMSQVMRKCVLCHMRTTKVQISLRIHADQHLCCSQLRQYDMYTCCIQSFKILASFYSWAGWFESYLVEYPRRHIFAWHGSITVMILSFRTDRSGQTVQTQIRLLLEEQSDQGLHCLQFRLHFLGALPFGKAILFNF